MAPTTLPPAERPRVTPPWPHSPSCRTRNPQVLCQLSCKLVAFQQEVHFIDHPGVTHDNLVSRWQWAQCRRRPSRPAAPSTHPAAYGVPSRHHMACPYALITLNATKSCKPHDVQPETHQLECGFQHRKRRLHRLHVAEYGDGHRWRPCAKQQRVHILHGPLCSHCCLRCARATRGQRPLEVGYMACIYESFGMRFD